MSAAIKCHSPVTSGSAAGGPATATLPPPPALTSRSRRPGGNHPLALAHQRGGMDLEVLRAAANDPPVDAPFQVGQHLVQVMAGKEFVAVAPDDVLPPTAEV